MKTLEGSIAERLYQMTSAKANDRDAFVNYLTIIERAEIKNDFEELATAVDQAAEELGMSRECVPALVHIENERIRAGGIPDDDAYIDGYPSSKVA